MSRRTKSPPWNPDAVDLVRLSEHLLYELQMTFALASRLDSGAGTVPNVDARNAEVEAFAMRLRLLIEFFWMESPQTIDRRNAFAADYFQQREQRLRPERPDALGKEFRARIGWGAAHLTYDRVDVTAKNAWWDVRQHVLPLARAAECFLTNVEPQKLAPGVRIQMSKSVRDFMVSFPDLEAPGDG